MRQNIIRFVRAVAIGAAVGGLTKAGVVLGLLEFDASTAAFMAGGLTLVVNYLLTLQRE